MIDLHLHTNHSDGTDTVENLLTNAELNKLNIISITDHDSVTAYKELNDYKDIYSGIIIPGVELKTFYNGIPMEVLGYGIDHEKINIHQVDTYEVQSIILDKFKTIGKSIGLKFDDSISVSKTDPSRLYAAITFAKEILKYEENKNILLNYGPEFEETEFYRVHSSNKESIFYFDESTFGEPLDKTVASIHDAGGLAFLAHPLLYPFTDKFASIEEILINYDLDGLECIYPLFSEEDRTKLIELAKKHNKYISGGTDYHGNNKPNIKIGSGIDNNTLITDEIINNWISKVNKY